MATNTLILRERDAGALHEKLALAVRDIELSGGEIKQIAYQNSPETSSESNMHTALVTYRADSHETAGLAELAISKREETKRARTRQHDLDRALFDRFQTAFGTRAHIGSVPDARLTGRGFSPEDIKRLTDVFVKTEWDIPYECYRLRN